MFLAAFHQTASHHRAPAPAPARRSAGPSGLQTFRPRIRRTRRKPFMANSNGSSDCDIGLLINAPGSAARYRLRLARLLRTHGEDPCRDRKLAVRAGADAEVVAKGPVVEVVDAVRVRRARSRTLRTARTPPPRACAGERSSMSSTISSAGCTGGAAAKAVPGSMVRWYCDRCARARARAPREDRPALPPPSVPEARTSGRD